MDNRWPTRPTFDQVYLGERLGLTLTAVQKLNDTYGPIAVEDAMRVAHGFGPEEIRSPYAYLKAILEDG